MRSRRELFTRLLTAVVEPPVQEARVPDPAMLPEYLRPPGAAGESELVELCERCGKCKEACPYGVILPLGPAYGKAEGTPAVLPRGGPCRLCEDLPCARACPSGALTPVPITEIRMGTARFDPAHCWAARGQPCDYCVQECPVISSSDGEKALRWRGNRPEVNEQTCVGCGLCVHICTGSEPALRIEPAWSRL